MENKDNTSYQKAVARVKCIKSFYTHLLIYVLVISLLVFINYRTTSFVWVLFPALGWGLGLLGHAMNAFEYNPILGKNWEERKIKELMEKDRL